jgi:hypothetical protein
MKIYISNTTTIYDTEIITYSEIKKIKKGELVPLQDVIETTIHEYLMATFKDGHEIFNDFEKNDYYVSIKAQL